MFSRRALEGDSDGASPGDEGPVTSKMILEDGVVTEEEYTAGARAAAACVTDAGFDTEEDFAEPDGQPTFYTPAPYDTRPGYTDQWEHCFDLHFSNNVSLGWLATLGQIDVTELREETTAVTECVEQRTGQDFGELTFDRFDYLTVQGQQTKDAAFEYQDHEPWGSM
jgi:hypothetical protein